MRLYSVLFAMTLAVLTTGCATHAMTSGRVVVSHEGTTVDVSFSDRDRKLIHDYYANHRGAKKTPPGLAKRGGSLPPGLAKRDVLPPGLQGRGLPAELELKLTPLPDPYVRVTIGTDVVLLHGRSRVVLDVIYGVAG